MLARSERYAEVTEMAYMIVRHKVADYAKWKAAFDEHVATRAYYIHLEGGPDPFENWLRAERELATA